MGQVFDEGLNLIKPICSGEKKLGMDTKLTPEPSLPGIEKFFEVEP